MEKPSSSVPKRRKKGNSKEKCAPFHRKGHIFCWKPNRRYPRPVPLGHSGNAFSKGMEPHGRCGSTGNTSCRNCASTNRTQFESPERGFAKQSVWLIIISTSSFEGYHWSEVLIGLGQTTRSMSGYDLDQLVPSAMMMSCAGMYS